MFISVRHGVERCGILKSSNDTLNCVKGFCSLNLSTVTSTCEELQSKLVKTVTAKEVWAKARLDRHKRLCTCSGNLSLSMKSCLCSVNVEPQYEA
ncbi:hypothetical protein ILYODFUR_017790 [Ilyodon furcidens]|uniref:Uncharacterized protein n=1 Tax=Ilyodon furcidens TaxID=33524 RepID=A0ABV0UW93_9TELE